MRCFCRWIRLCFVKFCGVSFFHYKFMWECYFWIHLGFFLSLNFTFISIPSDICLQGHSRTECQQYKFALYRWTFSLQVFSCDLDSGLTKAQNQNVPIISTLNASPYICFCYSHNHWSWLGSLAMMFVIINQFKTLALWKFVLNVTLIFFIFNQFNSIYKNIKDCIL